MKRHSVKGNVVDVFEQRIYHGLIMIENTVITAVEKLGEEPLAGEPFIIPGYIDSHVHIESSMLVPSEFARLAVVHGTVATVSDPHEIANVCGSKGVQYMIENGRQVNFKFFFGAPSCVPATSFETSGATINSEEVKQLLNSADIYYLSEMMNFPGVIHADKEVIAKIEYAKESSKPVDGHAPGLRGNDLVNYIAAGISTDHECFTKEEALEKLALGMKIIIREGSAAKNFDALIELLHDYPSEIMFCSDDKHPDSLVNGHINVLCSRAVSKGINIFHVLKAACINPVLHYRLPVGMLRIGDTADFAVVNDLKSFMVLCTYINGECVFRQGETLINRSAVQAINHFTASPINEEMLSCSVQDVCIEGKLPVIEALDGQLITQKQLIEPTIIEEKVVTDTSRDIIKLVVLNRYKNAKPAIAFIKNFGLKRGAIASTVAHDSHNIIAAGVNDRDMARAINKLIEAKGGISATDGNENRILPLPVAGLMSDGDGYKVAAAYTEIDRFAKSLGSSLSAPFMTLSFMALLVIPHLKLSDRGLFDGEQFSFLYP